MGSEPSYNKPVNMPPKKIVMQVRTRTIILHNSYKMSLQISDVAIFPHGCQGLKLWDSDIIGARYIIMNHQKFANKDIFVLNGRVGICGIAFRKWTKCKSIIITDFTDEVVGNIKRNCTKNELISNSNSHYSSKLETKTNNEITVYKFNFQQLNHYSPKYDTIFIVDAFCKGFPVKQLYQLLKRFLKIQGRAVIIVPQRQDDRQKFFAYVKDQNQISRKINKNPKVQNNEDEQGFYFQIRKVQNKLIHEQYFASPLPNKVQGLQEFPLLNEVDFSVYNVIKKIQDQQIDSPVKKHQLSAQQQKKIEQKQEQPQKQNTKFQQQKNQITEQVHQKIQQVEMQIQDRNQELNQNITNQQKQQENQIKNQQKQNENKKEQANLQGKHQSQSNHRQNQQNQQSQEKKQRHNQVQQVAEKQIILNQVENKQEQQIDQKANQSQQQVKQTQQKMMNNQQEKKQLSEQINNQQQQKQQPQINSQEEPTEQKNVQNQLNNQVQQKQQEKRSQNQQKQQQLVKQQQSQTATQQQQSKVQSSNHQNQQQNTQEKKQQKQETQQKQDSEESKNKQNNQKGKGTKKNKNKRR